MAEPSRKGVPPRLSHVGIALPTINSLLPFLRDVLGMEEAPVSPSDGARITGLQAGTVLVELMEGDVEGSPVDKFVKSRGPGIHHICFEVQDLEGVLERCRRAGIRLVDEKPRIGAEGKRIAFLHPKSTGGILIELSEQSIVDSR